MKYQYLNKKDEYRLLNEYQISGSTNAFDKLVLFNQLNVKMEVEKFIKTYDDFYEDAIQEANFALITAINTFKTSTNNRLISYASTLIYNQIIKEVFTRFNTIKIPYTIHKNIKLYEEGKHHLTPVMKKTIAYNFNCYDIDEHSEDEFLIEENCDYEIEHLENEIFKKIFEILNFEERFIIERIYGLNGKPKMKQYEIEEYFSPNESKGTRKYLIQVKYRKIKKKIIEYFKNESSLITGETPNSPQA